ncbi:hypothetical protein [Sphingomonas quercus]|uniref:Lipopolysaccharide assembly protein A domain-containing protein n=1 Tax=Sphingomonas quercus TaxID=2842451 RepID=A0ABS6BNI4_9SPHN|nr:hypothetical protein [Sphingomonas quercus]MBU3079422.1 hypothetical protein [Sphingomonas quercus]
MQFLKTLFWVILAVAIVIFSLRNWTVVTLTLWSGLRLDAKLPVLLMVAFLAGLLPTLGVLQATRWRLRRRLDAAERALADVRLADTATPTVVAADHPANLSVSPVQS